MERQDYVKEVAVEIFNQIRESLTLSEFLSWGASDFRATFDPEQKLPGLMFFVRGRLFEGIVIVLLNWDDTYIVQKYDGREMENICDKCYCDNLADVIDRHIERGENEAEYMEFCESERQKLLQMGIDENTKVFVF